MSQCELEVFGTVKSLVEIEQGLLRLEGVRLQVVLCQFVHYLIQNSLSFLPAEHYLYSHMSTHLHHLTHTFNWSNNKCLNQMMKDYILPESNPKITTDNYHRLKQSIEGTIMELVREGRGYEASV